MRSWSIPVGRLFGVDVRVHLTFVVLPLFIFWTEYAAHQGSANGPRDLALVGIILACVAAHECGHMLAARRVGLIPKAVILLPLTGVALYDESRTQKAPLTGLTWKRDIRLALIGPLISLALACLAAAAVTASGRGVELWKWPFLQAANLPRSLVWANLYLAILNLMPAYPLDGGRVLRALLSRTLEASTATRRAVSISNAIAMVLMLAGLFSDSWLTMVGVIVFSAAQLEERALVFQSVLDNVRLEEVMLTDFATLSPADTLEDALEKAVHSLQDDFPVVRGSDMVGVISKQRILEALRAEGNGYVQAVMNKIFEVSLRQDSLSSAFRKLTARNSSIIPVVEDQHLIGIVTLQNLMHSMALLAESRKLRRDEAES
ncbi:MAG TPA: site-2 protease family protein [Candidatus Acidoferrum sp.]|jgi:Zn-dependent protease/CBS domain-containing protein|nr:site-2 protease family protein [Candidatus Acidoferrum sp.]